MIKNLYSLFTIFILLSQLTIILAQTIETPAPPGPTNITAILENAGQFTTLIRILKNTQLADQINAQLNHSNQGMTLFAPPDNAFSALKAGALNSLTDQEKAQLILFHVIPNFYTMSEFQTVSNPLRTQAGNTSAGQFPLNVTTSGINQVNISTGINEATVANTIYTDDQLAVYQIDKVLLPLAIFSAPVPAAAPAPTNSTSRAKSPVADTPATGNNTVPTDVSGAIALLLHGFHFLRFAFLSAIWLWL
ncbi:hypothetical protein Leryth_009506 [Lithospermum erythrorhizon]|uniref:Cell adhesion molecule n=1 Tax=Lithospermum erythrorhizon TaxID=34254 RepID=A0AAV3QQQ5_LITER|nr:hypothetical protein Leryth_009506 [Lithospermum erythrorhizon]